MKSCIRSRVDGSVIYFLKQTYMDIKQTYLNAMMEDNGRLSEIELGERLGLKEDETARIISKLLDEFKIEFTVNGACNYKPLKNKRS